MSFLPKKVYWYSKCLWIAVIGQLFLDPVLGISSEKDSSSTVAASDLIKKLKTSHPNQCNNIMDQFINSPSVSPSEIASLKVNFGDETLIKKIIIRIGGQYPNLGYKPSVPDSTVWISPPENSKKSVPTIPDDWVLPLCNLLANDPILNNEPNQTVAESIAELLTKIGTILRLTLYAKKHQTNQFVSDFFELGFSNQSYLLRDRYGYAIRQLKDLSFVFLVQAAEQPNSARLKRRYAKYLLSAMGMDNPKAMLTNSMGGDHFLQYLTLYGSNHVKDAIVYILGYTSHENATVRGTAQYAYLSYLTGPTPKPSPKKQHQLPRGKLTKEETADSLNYYEIAVAQIEKEWKKIFNVSIPKKWTWLMVAKKVFEEYDKKIYLLLDEKMDTAFSLAKAGQWEDGKKIVYQIMASNPNFSGNKELARWLYLYIDTTKNSLDKKEILKLYKQILLLDPNFSQKETIASVIEKSNESSAFLEIKKPSFFQQHQYWFLLLSITALLLLGILLFFYSRKLAERTSST